MDRISNRALKKLISNHETNVNIALSNEKLSKYWKSSDYTLYEVEKHVSGLDGEFEVLDSVSYYNNKLYPNSNGELYIKTIAYNGDNTFKVSTKWIQA